MEETWDVRGRMDYRKQDGKSGTMIFYVKVGDEFRGSEPGLTRFGCSTGSQWLELEQGVYFPKEGRYLVHFNLRDGKGGTVYKNFHRADYQEELPDNIRRVS